MTSHTLDDLALAGMGTGDLVVDIGAGSGAFSRAALAAGCRVIAVDASGEACRALGAHDRLQVIHGAIAAAGPGQKFVARLGRALVTNARDAVTVPVVTVRDLLSQHGPGAGHVLRVRAAGQLAAAIDGADGILSNAGGLGHLGHACIRLIGDALVGDDAGTILGHFDGWSATALTAVGLRSWTAGLAPFVPTLDWLLTTTPSESPVPTDDDIVHLALLGGRAADPAHRTRVAAALGDQTTLIDNPDISDLLDELALDPDHTTWYAARWWRSHLRTVDHRQRSHRRARAHDRLIERLTCR